MSAGGGQVGVPKDTLDPSFPRRGLQSLEVDSTEEGQVTLQRGHTQTHPRTAGPWRPASGPQDTRSGRSRPCCGSARWDRARGRPHTHSHLSNESKEERHGLEAPRSCTPRAQDTQVVIGEAGGDSASLRLGSHWEDLGTKWQYSALISKTLTPMTCICLCVTGGVTAEGQGAGYLHR